MIYAYGCLYGMESYDPCGTADTLEAAMVACEELQQEWNGSHASDWKFVRGRWLAGTDEKGVYWYVREIKE